MTVITKIKPRAKIIKLAKPEDIKDIVRSRNHLVLYHALKNITFRYNSLYKYLLNEFEMSSIEGKRSRSELISELMEVSESTFYRWKTSKKLVDEKYAERLSELMNLFTYGEEVFESKKLFNEWLNSSNIHLKKKPPIQFLDSFSGIRYINHLLDKIEYGAPV